MRFVALVLLVCVGGVLLVFHVAGKVNHNDY
jgi:hypothetical protein